jgi:hypothetical protein
MRENKLVLIVVIISVLFSVGIVIAVGSDLKCDEEVTMVDGTKYECRSVSSFNNGMSAINLCDGSRVSVPTHRIKIIIKVEDTHE